MPTGQAFLHVRARLVWRARASYDRRLVSAPPSSFVFVLCQRGAEKALKQELLRLRPSWVSAYQRPGLVTFRTPEPVAPDVPLDSVFARLHGQSLGSVPDLDGLLALVAHVDEPLRVHVIERDLHRPDEAPPAANVGALAARLEAELRARALPNLRFGPAERSGELVLDVVVAPAPVRNARSLAEPPAAADAWLVGLHRHGPGRCPHPGGRYPVQVPADAPSRAYAKIEEAIQAFHLPVRAGQRALELGASPGGAAYALCRRGVSVLAVDPAVMDPVALSFVGPGGAMVRHLAVPMGALEPAMVDGTIDWLLMDVHLAPQVALHGVRRIVSMLSRSLRGVVFTLKLNDWAFAERIPEFMRQVEAMGVSAPRVKQLASHRQEVAIAGLLRTPRP